MTIVFSFHANHHNRDQATLQWAVNLMIANDHLNLRQGFVWVCMGQHTPLIMPEGVP